MKICTLLAVILVLSSAPLGAERPLTLRVSPAMAFAPSNVRAQATIPTDEDNRSIEIVAESENYYRSSEIQLDGSRAPRTTVVEFLSLPGGSYSVRAVLKGVVGKELASILVEIRVIGRGETAP